MTLKPPHETFVHNTTDLRQLWQDMMGSGGFAQRSLWLIFLYADGSLCNTVMPIDGISEQPDERMIDSLGQIVNGVFEDLPGSVAFLLSRPGPPQMLDSDRRWARALHDTIDPRRAPWPIHLATDERIQVFAPDDLIAA